MNSKKRCTQCKCYFEHETMIKAAVGNFCGNDCRIDYGLKKTKKLLDKSKQIQDKKFSKKKREFKESDTNHQHKLTQISFNKLRVLQELKWFKDKGIEPYCISCGKTHMDWCCGHFKTRGAQGNLRYDELNTYLQCNRYCNMGLSGNIAGDKNTHGYKQGLVIRFGGERAQSIIDYCETNTQAKKWTGSELVLMRKSFNSSIRKLL